MESKTGFCIYCHSAVSYREEETYVLCKCCHRSFAVALFGADTRELDEVKQQLKLRQEEVEQLTADKQKLEAEELEHREKLSGALSSLASINDELSAQNLDAQQKDAALKRLEELTESVRRDTTDSGELLRALIEEQKNGNGTLVGLVCAVAETRESTEEKLNEIASFVKSVLKSQDDAQERSRMLLTYQAKLNESVTRIMAEMSTKATADEEFMRKLTVANGRITELCNLLGKRDSAQTERLGKLDHTLDGVLSGVERNHQKLLEINKKLTEGSEKLDKIQSTLDSMAGGYRQRRARAAENICREADKLLASHKFDSAYKSYQDLLQGYSDVILTPAEIHWRKVLCLYGMEYVWSDFSNRAVATLYILNLGDQQGDYEKQDVLNACANAEEKAKYRALIEEIDGIIDGYRRVHYDEHYDVFVSVKQKNGDKLTEDSKRAFQISRTLLMDYNLKVFNSELTPPPVGENYEPYILSALKSAKLLIVVTGSEEHAESPWVKNEWNRYLYFMRSEMRERNQTDRHLLPYLFGDMRNNQLPSEIQDEKIQIITEGFDAGKQLDELISRVFPEKCREKQERDNKQRQETEEATRKRKEAEEAARKQKEAEEAARRQKEAEETERKRKEAEEAARKLKELIDKLPLEVVERYLGTENSASPEKTVTVPKSTVQYKVGDIVKFGTYPQTKSGTDKTPIEWFVLDKKGDEYLLISKHGLDCVQYNTKWIGVTWETCSLRSWLNRDFYNKAFNADEKKGIVPSKVTADKNPDFSTTSGNDTTDNVFLLSVPEANRYFRDDTSRMCVPTDYAVKNGTYTNNNYVVDDSSCCWWWLRSSGSSSDYATYVDRGGSCSCFGNCVHGEGSVRPCVWVRLSDETTATPLPASTQKPAAAPTITPQITATPAATTRKVGDIVKFGTYPQTKSGTDKTPIEWFVLDKKGDEYLLISKHGLDCVQYNTKRIGVTWETCSLRSWLNSDFYNKAFSADEKQRIVLSKVTADKNPDYSTNPGNGTTDNVFLLSISEVYRYFKDDTSRMCAPTYYAVKNGAYTNIRYTVDGRASWWWWLRSPGFNSCTAAHVRTVGSVSDDGFSVNRSYNSVRPCVWVRLF